MSNEQKPVPRDAKNPRCRNCDKPATCFGSYESNTNWGYACDDCCGHGNEDGTCEPISDALDEYPERMNQLQAVSGAASRR